MKIKKLLLLSILALGLAGCITKNPDAGKVDPSTGKPFPDYVADTASLSNAAVAIHGAIQATAPINPYAGLMDGVVGAVIGLIGAGSAAYARIKKAKAVTDDLANATVKSGNASSVLRHATDSPHFATIANAINENTGANQTNTGETKVG